ncbi:MAG: hypothetical protein GC193_15045 [Cryomorphaceae bacterium]|nr:hypothetical protein [Cryomorphaceae bacterium]
MKQLLLTILGLISSVLLFSQSITILTPNGGNIYQGCTTQNITWVDNGTSNFYTIDYSTDNGASWTSIATFYNTTSGSYAWTVPNIQSTQALIRIQDSNNNLIQDVSDSVFSMIAPLIVTSPNGGEAWAGGSTHAITWVATGTSNYYVLDYSLDGGSSWISINSYLYNTNGYYSWSVPNTPSTSALVRVRDYNAPCKTDQSNATFTILAATPSISIYNPVNNGIYYSGVNYSITWFSEYVISNQVQIELSTDGGATWTYLSTLTENDGTFSWIPPTVVSNNCFIRVTDLANPNTFDLSSPFNIAEPFIDITYPTSANVQTQCVNFNINWNHGGTSNSRFRLYYSTDGGVTWPTIVTSVYGTGTTGTYTWTYPPFSGPVLIKVADYNNLDNNFEVSQSINILQNNDIIVTSPNGGESLEVGTTQSITWADAAPVNYVDLYYSTDNGVTWIAIDTYENSDGLFNWTIPNTPSTQCRLRVRDYENGNCRFDISDAVFTIAPPTPYIDNVSPGNTANGVYYSGLNYNVTWTSGYLTSPFVAIDLSYDNGATYTNLIAATENDGTYAHLLPAIYSETCRYRVREVGSAVEDISDFTFAVRQPFIDITYPTSADVQTQCVNFNINWNHGGTSNSRFRLYYSIDGGVTWPTIVTSVYGTSTTGTYTWTYPPFSGPVLIKVADYNNLDNNFEVSQSINILQNNDIIVTSPNGGESLEVGTTHNITWADAAPVNFVDLYYSTDNGVTWIAIDTYENSDGLFNWTIPNTPSTQCRLRVRDYENGNCRFDISDAVFTIAPPTPYIDNVSPGNTVNGVYYSGLNYNVTWTSGYLTSPFVAIDLSYDNGATYTNLIAATENDGTYAHLLPAIYSETCRYRVREVGSAVEDISDFTFAVRQPFIDITYPTTADVQTQCVNFNINWNHGGTSNSRFRLYYSIDGGVTWATIVTSVYGTSTTGSYTWTYPPFSGPVLIKVADYNNLDTNFEVSQSINILQNNDIIVTSPNGGESLEVGTTHNITWADAAPVNYVDLYYSTDNGVTWIAIDTYENSDGLFNWTIPNTPSTQCRLRVRDNENGNCRYDISDAVFSIVQPQPTVLAPNGGQTYYQGQTISINWISNTYPSQFVVIEYSLNLGSTWTTISAAETNDGSYSWLIPAISSTMALVRVTDYLQPTFTDQSDITFSIATPIQITSPNGDNGVQEWRVCTETTITWTSGGTSNYFKISYSPNNGTTWISLNNNYYSPGFNNAYNWILPSDYTPAALVRVEDKFNSSQNDISDNTFTIAPALTVLAPNGGETLGVGEQVLISWLNEGATNYIDIDYSINGGSTWTNIVFNTYLPSSQYLWTVPGNIGSNYVIRVRDNVNNCKSDISDSPFSVSSTQQVSIVMNSPNGQEVWAGCTQHTIAWSSLGTSDYYDLAYTLDGGSTWIEITTNYFSTSKTYTWTVPNANTTNAYIRVSDHNSLIYNDQSNVAFTITGPIANAGQDITICSTGSTYLQGSGGVSYSWSPTTGLSNPIAATTLAQPTTATTYNLTVTDVNGCTATDQVTVNIDNGQCDISGCMDSDAYNYNPLATIDDGFCLYTTGGVNSCPTDITGDGVTNVSDLLTMLGGIGTSCE